MKRTLIFVVLVVVFSTLIIFDADAQCAMCKLNAESMSKDKVGFAEGLNTGIVYLMGIPYALLAFGGIAFYRSFMKREAEETPKS